MKKNIILISLLLLAILNSFGQNIPDPKPNTLVQDFANFLNSFRCKFCIFSSVYRSLC